MYMHLGLLQYLRGSGVLLSCLYSITSACANSPDSKYYFVFLSGPALESAGVITHNDSFNTNQNFFMLCKKFTFEILAGVDVARIWDLGTFKTPIAKRIVC
jgi:hypothetical protein